MIAKLNAQQICTLNFNILFFVAVLSFFFVAVLLQIYNNYDKIIYIR